MTLRWQRGPSSGTARKRGKASFVLIITTSHVGRGTRGGEGEGEVADICTHYGREVACKKGVGPSGRSRHSSSDPDLIGPGVGCIVLLPGCRCRTTVRTYHDAPGSVRVRTYMCVRSRG